MYNHHDADRVVRRDELERLLRLAVQRVARQLQVAVPPSKRSPAESVLLKDCARVELRRTVSPETLAQLLEIGSRAETPHFLSEAIRQIEVGIAPVVPVDVFDASEAEQELDASLDMAQLKLRDKSPARLQQIAEIGPRVIASVRRLVDAANRALSARPA